MLAAVIVVVIIWLIKRANIKPLIFNTEEERVSGEKKEPKEVVDGGRSESLFLCGETWGCVLVLRPNYPQGRNQLGKTLWSFAYGVSQAHSA